MFATNVIRDVQESLDGLQLFPRPMNEILAVDEMDAFQRHVVQPSTQVVRVAADANRRPARVIRPGNEVVERGIMLVPMFQLHVVADRSHDGIAQNENELHCGQKTGETGGRWTIDEVMRRLLDGDVGSRFPLWHLLAAKQNQGGNNRQPSIIEPFSFSQGVIVQLYD